MFANYTFFAHSLNDFCNKHNKTLENINNDKKLTV
jgi:hypothetical protein